MSTKPEELAAMTQKQYVECEGLACPICELKGSVEGGSIEIDGGAAYQDCNCSECGAQWTDYYQLAGFDNLTQWAVGK